MNEEFLSGLGIEKEISDLILAEYEGERLQQNIITELKNAGTVDEKAAKTLLDTEGLTAENLKERIEDLKKEHPTLFIHQKPKFVSSAEKKSIVDKSEFSKMNYRERLELFKKNPETYKRLVE